MFDALVSIVLAFIAFFVSLPQPVTAPLSSHVAQVVSVIDGDTIEVSLEGQIQKVRYIGIDTPEPYRDGEPACFSHEATERNKELVEGSEVRLMPDREDKDKYGRLLRYVYVGETFVNATLVEEGFAKTLRIKPNTAHSEEFRQLQKEAKESQKGMWGECGA